jgi:hypothetical protein
MARLGIEVIKLYLLKPLTPPQPEMVR